MQTIVEKSLAKSGIVAVCVASEAGAEKALQTGKFDLLILGAAFG
jgi:DNA-binding response OmpR family regulator